MNSILVMKFGGSSLADAKKIEHVADIVAKRRQTVPAVVVVVSAMGRTTDGLIEQARQLTASPDPREMDMLLTAGVFATDPRLVSEPIKIPVLSYQEMQELGEAGAKVLHPKAVEFAKLKGTVVYCKSTFDPEAEGTVIKNLEGRLKPRIVGIATEERVVLVHVYEERSDTLDTVREVIAFAEERSLRVKQMSFHRGHNGSMVGSFIIPEKENYHLPAVLEGMRDRFGAFLDIHGDLAAVSLVGAGITERHEFLLEAIEVLQKQGIGAGSLHTSSFRISILVPRNRLGETTRLLYDRFFPRSEK